ncbi:transposase [Rhodococcus globerulus]|uniref:transposase n=1 Tax=Rhodococcus globerulus TaxID=33008 RepID=UPI001F2E48F9|nr:transposase [Rhodococcus globerulus]
MDSTHPDTQGADRSHTVFASDTVADIATETGISPATLFRWKDQALIDAGVRGGVPSIESDELASARNRIAALEAELTLTRDACALFDDQSVVPQTASSTILGRSCNAIYGSNRLRFRSAETSPVPRRCW